MIEAQERLAAVRGVSVLIHDQACAASLRRARKRGAAATPERRVAINPRLCEGCGDCGRISNCLSVQPVETPFGRKTAIDQTTCNVDLSCLEGDCPSFMTIATRPGRLRRLRRALLPSRRDEASPASVGQPLPEPPAVLPEPELAPGVEDFAARIAGIGGTGVVTVSQLLGTAAAFDGFEVRGLDQIGLSQKAGPVVSDLRLRRGGPAETNRLGSGQADLVLAFDALVAASPNGLAVADPLRTAVVGSISPTPTGAMIARPSLGLPGAATLEERLAAVTREGKRYWADAAGITTALFGDAVTANLYVVGMAVQAGCLPIRSASIERAITLNGVDVERNHAAFRWGRAQITDPDALAAAVSRSRPARATEEPALSPDLEARVAAAAGTDETFTSTLRLLAGDLVDHQDARQASAFLALVSEAADRETAVAPGSTRLALAIARGFHKLLAYKDEYEVARLLLRDEGLAPARRVAGEDARIAWRLHPPLLRALGMKRKIAVGTWAAPAFRLLAKGKRLRGSRLDPFGRTRVRRIERALPGEYRDAMLRVLRDLKAEDLDDAVTIASLPDEVRGYEDIKLGRVNAYRARLAEELERFTRLTRAV
jgi:indolepyruvate ferredoxin oxidoreductase